MIYKVILLLTIVGLSLSAECHGKPGDPAINLNPILKAQPQLLKTHKYGKLFEVGSGTSKMKLLHVYGDMYQMGFAHGLLLKTELNQMMTEVWEYLKTEFQDAIPKKVPAFLKKPAAGVFIATALDLTYEITSPYTNRKYYQEMRGIADGSGVSLRLLRRIHMIGELTKGTCSMFGAWGKATLAESLIQLRALDWDVDGPFWKYPLVTIYHPSSQKYGNSWANVGFYGWLGVISGANAQKLAISEIGVYFNDQTFGKESRFGNPFTFVLRDILQWDKTLNESISRLKSAKRTCNLILGVGDGKSNEFRSFQYSHSVLNVINDTHLLPKNDTWHPVVEDVVYYAMDWLCPAYNRRLYDLLAEYHGKITIENTISHIAPGVKSGNLQSVVYDVANQWMYVSYGIVTSSKKVVNAYERPFLALNLRQLFNQPMPASP